MRATHRFLASAAVALAASGTSTASADHAPNHSDDRTGAPYILVTSQDAQVDSLPLEETRADVQIAGVMAHVTVTQVYKNRGQVPLEARYVFPGSTRAAVFGMQMTVGERVTRAEISKRAAARKLYEKAREQGKTASLLEQHRPNVFQMNVANILPGDTVKVELYYTELITPTDSIYEFVYPAVVGPRYAGEQTSGETWHKNHHVGSGAGAPYRYGVNVRLATGVPLYGLTSPSHRVKPTFSTSNRARLALTSHRDGDRDFVLRYRLRGGEVATGMLRFEAEDENYFLLMVQPPERVKRDDMPAREYVFIVDVSGSMNGFPLDVSKRLVIDLLQGLRAQDTFNILFFAGSSYQLSPRSMPASRRNISRAVQVLGERRGGGGTNLVAALEKALNMPAKKDTSRTFVAVTDGYISADDRAFATVRENLGEANFFAFGIGRSVNRNLIEGLARAGMGEPFVVLDGKQAPRQAQAFRKLIEAPLLTGVKARFDGFEAYDVVPARIPDLFAERPLVVFGKYRGPARGSVAVTGTSGTGRFEKRVAADSAPPSPDNAGLRYLWARHRIAELSDRIAVRPTKELTDAVTKLGLKYSLLTKYTSFVAVDQRVRNRTGQTVGVDQPLPTPAGVSNPSTAAAPTPPSRPIHTASRPLADPTEVVITAGSTSLGPDLNVRLSSVPGVAMAEVLSIERAGAPILDERSSTLSAAIVPRFALSQRLRVGTRDDVSAFSLPTQLRVGIANTFEARVGSTLYTRTAGDNLQPDLVLGGKLRMTSTYGWLALSLFAEHRATFDDIDPERSRTRLALLGSFSLAQFLAVRVNLGGAHRHLVPIGGPNDRQDVFGLAYGLDVAFPSLLGARAVMLYPHIGVAGIAGRYGLSNLEVGTAMHFGEAWSLGLLLQLGLTAESDDLAGGLLLRYAL